MSYINKQTTIYEGDVYITGSQDPSIYGIGNLNVDGNFNINNRFSISDTSNSINSTTASFTVYGGFSINGSQNATSYTSGGGLTIAGGLAIGQDTYIGGILNMNSNKIISLATCTNQYDAVNKYYVDSKLSLGFSSSNIIISNATINNLVSTNISFSTISTNSATIPNSVFTNISSGTILANLSTISNSVFTNISSGTILANLSTISNSVFTNISSGTISAINITTSNIKVTGTTSVSTPINASDAVTKAYVDSLNTYYSVSVGTTTANTSTSDSLIPNMSLITNTPGAYSINFNCEYNIPAAYNTVGFSTATATSDLNLIYNDIISLTQTQTHVLSFGSGETLYPGIYDVAGAMSITGTLTLDGQGNSNSLFVIRGTAAFNTSASTVVTLINGAQSKNVYWVAQDAIGLGASTNIKGLIFSNSGAIAVGTDCNISGRLFTKSGAIAFGPGILSRPIGTSTINLRSLENFIIFTGFGGVANTGVSTYTGDISTNSGAITGFSSATVNGTIYQSGSSTTITEVFYIATFSLYVNNILVPYSYRTKNNKSTDVYLQGVATVINGDTVAVKYRISNQTSDNGGIININNRILTITKIN